MQKRLFRPLAVLLSLFALSGCGIIDMLYLPPAEDTAQEIFEAGNDALRDKDYVGAVKYYNKLRDAYPFSPYTLEAELALADAYFLDGEFELAAEAYKDFETLHPRHDAIPYVLFQTGNSLMRQFRSVDHSTVVLAEACEFFNRLAQTWPDSPYVQQAMENVKTCRRNMAEHELYIADVFWHMKKFGPAWRRYEHIAQEFADVPEVADHVREKAVAAHHNYRERQAAETRERREGSWKDWFSWL